MFLYTVLSVTLVHLHMKQKGGGALVRSYSLVHVTEGHLAIRLRYFASSKLSKNNSDCCLLTFIRYSVTLPKG